MVIRLSSSKLTIFWRFPSFLGLFYPRIDYNFDMKTKTNQKEVILKIAKNPFSDYKEAFFQIDIDLSCKHLTHN